MLSQKALYFEYFIYFLKIRSPVVTIARLFIDRCTVCLNRRKSTTVYIFARPFREMERNKRTIEWKGTIELIRIPSIYLKKLKAVPRVSFKRLRRSQPPFSFFLRLSSSISYFVRHRVALYVPTLLCTRHGKGRTACDANRSRKDWGKIEVEAEKFNFHPWTGSLAFTHPFSLMLLQLSTIVVGLVLE